MLSLPTAAISVIEILQQKGFEAFAVGGCVRDALMGKACHDIDITTDALPEQVACAFENYTVIPTGIKHGTVTVMIKNEPVEITTYRTEGEYTDLRRPDKVSFVGDIRRDLVRRDFTINAICYNPQMGVCDYQQGCEDVKNKVIRCVGQARKRFSEDPLRILRGLRFSSVLEFSIENSTEKAMFEMAPLLKNVSGERLLCEMSKLLCGKGIKAVLLKYSDILSVIIPEIKAMKNFKQNNPHHIYDVLTHTAVALENTPPEEILRFAVLFHDMGKPFCYTQDEKGVGHFYRHPKLSEKISETVMNRLKADNNMKKAVSFLVLNHDMNIPPTEKSVKRALNIYGYDMLIMLLKVKRADNCAQNTKDYDRRKEYDLLDEIIDKILLEKICFSLKDLAVNGDDLILAGVPKGKRVGEGLNLLLEQVIDEKIQNEKSALLVYTKGHLLK